MVGQDIVILLKFGKRGKVTGDVRKKGTETWDLTQNRWELKKRNIRKTPKQLSEILGEPVPEGKIASRPYWEKFLALLGKDEEQDKRKRSRLQDRLHSLDFIIESLQAESRDATTFIAERRRVLELPEWDIDNADFPAIHPDAQNEISILGLENDELAVRVLNSHHVKKLPTKGSVKQESEKYIATKKGKDKYKPFDVGGAGIVPLAVTRFPLIRHSCSFRCRTTQFGASLRADGYRRRDRGLLLVPSLTIFLTHATVMLDRPAGLTQMTFEWYLPHRSRSRNDSVWSRGARSPP